MSLMDTIPIYETLSVTKKDIMVTNGGVHIVMAMTTTEIELFSFFHCH